MLYSSAKVKLNLNQSIIRGVFPTANRYHKIIFVGHFYKYSMVNILKTLRFAATAATLRNAPLVHSLDIDQQDAH